MRVVHARRVLKCLAVVLATALQTACGLTLNAASGGRNPASTSSAPSDETDRQSANASPSVTSPASRINSNHVVAASTMRSVSGRPGTPIAGLGATLIGQQPSVAIQLGDPPANRPPPLDRRFLPVYAGFRRHQSALAPGSTSPEITRAEAIQAAVQAAVRRAEATIQAQASAAAEVARAEVLSAAAQAAATSSLVTPSTATPTPSTDSPQDVPPTVARAAPPGARVVLRSVSQPVVAPPVAVGQQQPQPMQQPQQQPLQLPVQPSNLQAAAQHYHSVFGYPIRQQENIPPVPSAAPPSVAPSSAVAPSAARVTITSPASIANVASTVARGPVAAQSFNVASAARMPVHIPGRTSPVWLSPGEAVPFASPSTESVHVYVPGVSAEQPATSAQANNPPSNAQLGTVGQARSLLNPIGASIEELMSQYFDGNGPVHENDPAQGGPLTAFGVDPSGDYDRSYYYNPDVEFLQYELNDEAFDYSPGLGHSDGEGGEDDEIDEYNVDVADEYDGVLHGSVGQDDEQEDDEGAGEFYLEGAV